MNPNLPRVDRVIADVLRAAAGEPYAGSLDGLAARIDAAAASVLDARRKGVSRTVAWWDYAAQWARALIPASLVVGAASIGFLWLFKTTEAAESSASSAIGAAVSPCRLERGCTPAAAVDKALDELVSPSTNPAVRNPR
jgi:hypothetical protein